MQHLTNNNNLSFGLRGVSTSRGFNKHLRSQVAEHIPKIRELAKEHGVNIRLTTKDECIDGSDILNLQYKIHPRVIVREASFIKRCLNRLSGIQPYDISSGRIELLDEIVNGINHVIDMRK